MAAATHHAAAKVKELCLGTYKYGRLSLDPMFGATIHSNYFQSQEEFPLRLRCTERRRDRRGARKVLG
jgi:hypothetical protein